MTLGHGSQSRFLAYILHAILCTVCFLEDLGPIKSLSTLSCTPSGRRLRCAVPLIMALGWWPKGRYYRRAFCPIYRDSRFLPACFYLLIFLIVFPKRGMLCIPVFLPSVRFPGLRNVLYIFPVL